MNSGKLPPIATKYANFFPLVKAVSITNKFTGPSCSDPKKLTKLEKVSIIIDVSKTNFL